ncbi:MAG TPA: hypothetical protein VGX70_04240, partial [Gemmataceae bacterium]|nr:hypothetical protein [Gemmataceae bacterium]
DDEAEPVIYAPGEDEASALIGTLPSSMSETPLCTADMPSMQLRRSFEQEQRRRMIFAILVSVGLAAIFGLLVLIVALS